MLTFGTRSARSGTVLVNWSRSMTTSSGAGVRRVNRSVFGAVIPSTHVSGGIEPGVAKSDDEGKIDVRDCQRSYFLPILQVML